jgi:hypothetical protein
MRDKRNASPFKTREFFERVLEHFGGDVLDIRAGVDATRHERIDAFEIRLIEVGEARRIALRRFDEKPLFAFVRSGLQPVLRRTRSL